MSDPSVCIVHCTFTVAMIIGLEIFSHPEEPVCSRVQRLHIGNLSNRPAWSRERGLAYTRLLYSEEALASKYLLQSSCHIQGWNINHDRSDFASVTDFQLLLNARQMAWPRSTSLILWLHM